MEEGFWSISMDTEGQVIKLMQEIFAFLEAHSWSYSFSNVKILCNEGKQLRDIPDDWKESLDTMDISRLKAILLNPPEDQCEHDLISHFSDTRRKLIEKIDAYYHSFESESKLTPPRKFFNEMSMKKQHEVVELGNIIGQICKDLQIGKVVDVGAGLAYLPQYLAHFFGLEVLTLECQDSFIRGAQKRVGSCSKIEFMNIRIQSSNDPKDIEKVIAWIGKEGKALLVGLHACGDLTPNILRLFFMTHQFEGVLVLSCCYHKLMDKANMPMMAEKFPHDSVLFKPHALRLASQEALENWLNKSESDHYLHSRTFGYRAVLERFCERNNVRLMKKKRRAKKHSESAQDFVSNIFNAYDLVSDHLSEADMRKELIQDCIQSQSQFAFLEKLTGLQLSLQSLLEHFLILDRYLYLKTTISRSKVLTLLKPFNEQISPRNKAIFCVKKKR